MFPENRQVIDRPAKRAHREPCPIHPPKTLTISNRESPPDSPGGMKGGGGGDTQDQSTLLLVGKTFKENTATSLILYAC